MANFNEIFLEALRAIYRAKEYNGYLPAISSFGISKRVPLDIPYSTWRVFEELGEILQIPPQTIMTALATASALSFLEEIKQKKG